MINNYIKEGKLVPSELLVRLVRKVLIVLKLFFRNSLKMTCKEDT